MRMRFAGFLVAALVLPTALSSARADEPFHRPTRGNQFVTTTDKYLYVVWSVPKNLAPFAGIESTTELEAFIARTSVFLCHEHDSADPKRDKPCKVKVVRMNTNDEYTKSAAGGFKTVADLVLPRAHTTAETWQKTLNLPLDKLQALFSRLSVKHDRIPLPSAK